MAKNLLIVESPAKAKTIEKYLGKDFQVKSSMGHIRDLDKGTKAVDVANKFKPLYVIPPEKSRVVKDLKDATNKVEEVWLATDDDREGEAISWHLCSVLGLDEKTTKRIVFTEITKPAIQAAIKQPRTIDLNLVDAQQARRILDRLVGFDLSSTLWKKVKNKLSAGRVQSVTVKLVVEKERDIQNFQVTNFFKVAAVFHVTGKSGNPVELKAELTDRLANEKDAITFLESVKDAIFSISDIKLTPLKRKPAPPFTTSTLQQEASRKLGFGVNRTMQAAQRLYEAGHISYMRTDSITLSDVAIAAIAQEVEQSFGSEYVQVRKYSSKTILTQEAHEAIRPTYIENREAGNTPDEKRLYDLIRKRSLASQMAEARLEKTTVQIGISTRPKDHLQAEGEVLVFDGFLKVYMEGRDDEDEDADAKGILPPLSVGQILPLYYMEATERFTRPPARFTEASLVKKLEELGIGRPSTYAPTISKIMEPGRGYVVKESRPGVERMYRIARLQDKKIQSTTASENTGAGNNHLYPTDMGMIVTDFLETHFPEIMKYSFTAHMEEDFDRIAEGNIKWVKVLEEFYQPFVANVKETNTSAERASGERILGIDPNSGRTVLVRMSRFGPVVQIGKPEELAEEEKPRYANLRREQSMERITMEEAMELFKLPRDMGFYKDLPVLIAVGRFGPYVKWGEIFISIPREHDPIKMSMDTAIQIIQEKEKADAPFGYYEGLPITKGKGRFGPFVKWNGMFVNIPKAYSYDTINEADASKLIAIKVEKESKRIIQNFAEEKISVENARWGPVIKLNKKFYSLPRNEDGTRATSEQAALLTLEEVKAIVIAQDPEAFEVKGKKGKAKAPSAKKKKPEEASTNGEMAITAKAAAKVKPTKAKTTANTKKGTTTKKEVAKKK